MILITGASGTVGSAVLAEVRRAGLKHRAMYRSEQEAAKAPANTETVVADFADKASLMPALEGVESVFLVCSPIPDLVTLESNVIEAAEAAGVRRIVLNSALGAGDWDKSYPSWHRKVEDKLKSANLAHCILRPNSFLQNLLAYFAPSIRAQGAFFNAMGSARNSYLDIRDIAAVAANVLGNTGHDGKTYELNGPEALTCSDIADRISRHTGVLVRYVAIPADAQRQSMLELGMPEWQVNALLNLQEYYTSGHGGEVDGLLEELLGRSPIGIDRFLQEFAGAFTKSGMTHGEARDFIRNHFEEFVNKKNVDIGYVNFAPDFVDHGADVPPGMPPGPAGAVQYVAGALKRFPDLHVQIDDMIAEDDRVVVRNHWTATDSQSGKKLEFRGIVIWRIADKKIVERWAYLEAPHEVRSV